MSKLQSTALAIVLSAGISPAWGAQWIVEPSRSTIAFGATFEGAEFGGVFTRYAARLFFDPDDLGNSRFDVRIDVSSADTGSGELNEGMLLPDWFDSGRYPQATFVTSQIQHSRDNRYVAVGSLEIKGISRQVRLPFSWTAEGDSATIEGEATLNRGDFRIGEGEWASGAIVGLPVKVSTHLQLTRGSP